MGVSGSGKSHVGRLLAERLSADFIDGDDHHSAANIAKMARGTPLNDQDRQGWLTTLAGFFADYHRTGRSVVIGCSALKARYRNILRGGDPALAIIYLDASRAVLRERLCAREGHFFSGEAMLDSQLADLEPPARDEAFWVAVSQPPDAMVDQALAWLNSPSRQA
ncbi:gluconate kinase [Halomonas sp. 1513]|nr:gluconate kinase [Halomonas sp. 1513]